MLLNQALTELLCAQQMCCVHYLAFVWKGFMARCVVSCSVCLKRMFSVFKKNVEDKLMVTSGEGGGKR